MFGYVTVYKDLISEADYDVFRSYYCGLCRDMGKRCSQASRFGLSYDITFLALVLSSVCGTDGEKKCGRCMAHPFRKNNYIYNDFAVGYAADAAVMLDYLKLLDDWHDEKSVKALFGMLILKRAVKKASSRHEELYEGIRCQLNRLSRLEEKNSENIDETADCFAKILELLFTPVFIDDENERRILGWMGYNIGRWIYIIDAVNDMKKDYESKSYNPFNIGFEGGNYDEYAKDVKNRQELALTFTLDNAASAFELLNVRRNETLLRSIIYDCLKARQQQILIGEKNEPI